MFGISHNILKHFTKDTGQGVRAIVGWVCFIPFFEDRGYIGFFPNCWMFACIEGSLIDKLQKRGKFFVKGLQDYWFKYIRASSLVGFRIFSSFSMPFMEAWISHYVNVFVLIKFSQKTSVFTLIIISSP